MNYEEFRNIVPSEWHFQIAHTVSFSVSFQGEKTERDEWRFFACNNSKKEVSFNANSLEDLLRVIKQVNWS